MKPSYWRLIAAAFAMITLASAYYRMDTAPAMVRTANAFLDSLTADQRAKATFAVNDDERQFWHFIPDSSVEESYGRPRRGLTLLEMTAEQRLLAGALLSAGLSRQGHIKATTIMSLEEVLRVMEGDSGARRNPLLYHFSIFGTPKEKGAWGYRVEGHHVSLHYLVVDGELAASPTFLGANPAEVKQGPRKGLRALAGEEDLARALLGSLTAEQKKAAIVSPTAYKDILTSAERIASLDGQPSGLDASTLRAAQREMLDKLVAEYVNNMPPEVAEHRMSQYREAAGKIHFAWAGPTEKGGPHYYRVQAPAFLIEYDCTQNNANHIHAVWRDFQGDYGLDLLKEHYAAGH